jgi:hypothetical protein
VEIEHSETGELFRQLMEGGESVAEDLPSIHKALGSSPEPQKGVGET